jgi:superfamily I DNA/RNA helicase
MFVVGLEDGILPLSRDEATATDDEERRLVHVAKTRAKKRPVLTRAARRFWRGARRALPRPPFLRSIGRGLIIAASVILRQRHAFQPSLF